jgi:hypothetical protein
MIRRETYQVKNKTCRAVSMGEENRVAMKGITNAAVGAISVFLASRTSLAIPWCVWSPMNSAKLIPRLHIALRFLHHTFEAQKVEILAVRIIEEIVELQTDGSLVVRPTASLNAEDLDLPRHVS